MVSTALTKVLRAIVRMSCARDFRKLHTRKMMLKQTMQLLFSRHSYKLSAENPELSKVPLYKLGVSQMIVLHASSTTRNSALYTYKIILKQTQVLFNQHLYKPYAKNPNYQRFLLINQELVRWQLCMLRPLPEHPLPGSLPYTHAKRFWNKHNSYSIDTHINPLPRTQSYQRFPLTKI